MTGTPENSMDGQVVLITGAAKRIGAAIAKRLHAAGANVAIHYRASAKEADALRDTLNGLRENSAATFAADLNETSNIDGLVSDVIAWRGRLDVLVNNASSFYPTPLGEIDEENWSDLVGSNLKAPIFLSQAAAPYLRKTSGNIVNIVDIHAHRPLRNHAVYGSAKAGLVMLTRSLAKDLAPDVRVNGVAPGAIAWPENGMSKSMQENIIAQIPLGRTGAPDDIANAVRFFVCEATYCTGQILAIDGGRSIGW